MENDPLDLWVAEQLDAAPPLTEDQIDLIKRALSAEIDDAA